MYIHKIKKIYNKNIYTFLFKYILEIQDKVSHFCKKKKKNEFYIWTLIFAG